MSRRAKTVFIIIAVIAVITLLGHSVIRWSERFYSEDFKILLRLRKIHAAIEEYQRITGTVSPLPLSLLREKHAIPNTDIEYMMTNNISYTPWRQDDAADKVVLEHKGTYRRSIVFKSGEAIIEPYPIKQSDPHARQ
jgi:hypothetical protein